MGECRRPPNGLTQVEYQISGPGHARSVAECDEDLIQEPSVWLAKRLGSLAFCRRLEHIAPVTSAVARQNSRQR
jgi:hypothetical protein